MSRGRLHCLGTALHLKNKYGTGYTVDIKLEDGFKQEVRSPPSITFYSLPQPSTAFLSLLQAFHSPLTRGRIQAGGAISTPSNTFHSLPQPSKTH